MCVPKIFGLIYDFQILQDSHLIYVELYCTGFISAEEFKPV